MKSGKHLATLALCLAVLWGSRFGPYTCDALPHFVLGITFSWQSLVVTGSLLVFCLFAPAYDCISLLAHRLGWDETFEPLDLVPGDPPVPDQPLLSQKMRWLLVYPLDLVLVLTVVLPSWTKVAHCG